MKRSVSIAMMILMACLMSGKIAADDQAKKLQELTDQRVKALKDNLDKFELTLDYKGKEDKPFYRLTLSVPELNDHSLGPAFWLEVKISKDDAAKIIDHLAKTGCIGKAYDLTRPPARPVPATPNYTLTLRGSKDVALEYCLYWNKPLIDQLEALKAVLPADAAKQMDTLLERISFLKKADEAK